MIASASSAAGMRPSTLNVFRSNITTDRSLPDVAKPCPVASANRRAVGPVDARHLAEKLSVVFVHDHHAILPSDEQAMLRRIRHDVVPPAVSAQRVGMGNAVSGWSLCEQRGCNQKRGDVRHDPS